MALPETGPLSLSAIRGEFGGASPDALSEYYAGGSHVPAIASGINGPIPSSGVIAISDFYGADKGEARVNVKTAYLGTEPAGGIFPRATDGYGVFVATSSSPYDRVGGEFIGWPYGEPIRANTTNGLVSIIFLLEQEGLSPAYNCKTGLLTNMTRLGAAGNVISQGIAWSGGLAGSIDYRVQFPYDDNGSIYVQGPVFPQTYVDQLYKELDTVTSEQRANLEADLINENLIKRVRLFGGVL